MVIATHNGWEPATHLQWAADIVNCYPEWLAYQEALRESGLVARDGMDLLLTRMTDSDGPETLMPGPPQAPEDAWKVFYEIGDLCREALRYATPYLTQCIHLSGPSKVRWALTAATESVRNGNDPRWFF